VGGPDPAKVVYCFAVLFYQPQANWANMQEKNHFPEPNRYMLTFFIEFKPFC